MFHSRRARGAAAALVILFLAACSGGSQYGPAASGPAMPAAAPMPAAMSDASSSGADLRPDGSGSVLNTLDKKLVIGSTIDPKFHQLNPYGLTVAPSTAGGFTKGDLVVCNFNAKNNVQGTGYTIVDLHPVPGSTPTLISSSKTLLGCNALALAPGNFIWAAAFKANDNPVLGDTGSLLQNIKGKPLDHPFGQAYSETDGGAFYESNAGDGSIVRFNLKNNTTDIIAKGFAVNHGKPGSIFGPSGLTYDPKIDTLYIVDGTNNTLVAFSKVSTYLTGAITVGSDGTSFSGPSSAQAHVVFSGAPLNGPISAALLPNGNLVLGNTGNPSGTNLMVEISASGKLLATKNVDKGASGSLFGIVATGTSDADTKIYFNDDNDNNLQVLER